jgi:signal peptidase I
MSELVKKERDALNSDQSSDTFSPVPPPVPHETRNSSGRGAILGYTIFALALALSIRFFVAAPYVVSGSSMEPNFHNWDYLITDRISYRFEEPARGDVVVFHLPQEYSRTLIKRIIALPGETLVVNKNGVRIINAEHPDGFYLDEPYLSQENIGGPTDVTLKLDSDTYAVLGDNRRVSSDSRSWGELPRENIVGRVLLRLFPISQLGMLPAEARYLEE